MINPWQELQKEKFLIFILLTFSFSAMMLLLFNVVIVFGSIIHLFVDFLFSL